MNTSIHEIMTRISDLLTDCGWPSKARWFDEMKQFLTASDVHSVVFQEKLDELDRAMSGMGSFTDLPLNPPHGQMSAHDARKEQWRLAAELGELIKQLKQQHEDI